MELFRVPLSPTKTSEGLWNGCDDSKVILYVFYFTQERMELMKWETGF
jgi:hypothetical protein